MDTTPAAGVAQSAAPLDAAPLDAATAATGEFARLLPEIVRHVLGRLDRLETQQMTVKEQIAQVVANDALEMQDIADLGTAITANNAAHAAEIAALQSAHVKEIAALQAQNDAGGQVSLAPLIQSGDDVHAALQALVAGLRQPATVPPATTPPVTTPPATAPPATTPPATDPAGTVTGTGEDTGVVADPTDPTTMPAMPGM